MTEERAQEIYANGAELTTEELALYLDGTLALNGYSEDNIVRIQLTESKLPTWIQYADTVPMGVVTATAALFDWKLEHRGEGKWYLHPWGV